jgi:Ca2+-binding EF-hand superfamily protein
MGSSSGGNGLEDAGLSHSMVEELHKLFQYIDKDSRGFLEVSEIREFQAAIAESKKNFIFI